MVRSLVQVYVHVPTYICGWIWSVRKPALPRHAPLVSRFSSARLTSHQLFSDPHRSIPAGLCFGWEAGTYPPHVDCECVIGYSASAPEAWNFGSECMSLFTWSKIVKASRDATIGSMQARVGELSCGAWSICIWCAPMMWSSSLQQKGEWANK